MTVLMWASFCSFVMVEKATVAGAGGTAAAGAAGAAGAGGAAGAAGAPGAAGAAGAGGAAGAAASGPGAGLGVTGSGGAGPHAAAARAMINERAREGARMRREISEGCRRCQPHRGNAALRKDNRT